MKPKTLPTQIPGDSPETANLLGHLPQPRAGLSAISGEDCGKLELSLTQDDQLPSLKNSEKPYRLLIEAMNEGAITLLADGTILYCNPRFAEMVQTPIQQIIGSSFYQFVETRGRSILQNYLRQMPQGGVKAEFTLWSGPSNAFCLPTQLSIRLLDVSGVNAFAVVATDLTDRKRYEETLRLQNEELEYRVVERTAELTEVNQALQAAQEELRARARELEEKVANRTSELQATVKSLEQFCYTIAHDLRAPLRTMHGFSSALLDDMTPQLTDVARDYARRITAAASRMDEQIRALLAYGRLNSSEMPLVSTDPGALLEQLAKSDELKQAKIHSCAPFPRVLANPIALRQVLDNLLANAVKFVAPGRAPQVRIFAEAQGDIVRLTVEDNGIGINSKYHQRIFHVFERVAGSAYPGTGIGLAIVQKGVERMGGRVGVESTEGEGSKFWIELKKANQDAAVLEKQSVAGN